MGKEDIKNAFVRRIDGNEPEYTIKNRYETIQHGQDYFLFIQRMNNAFYFICSDLYRFKTICKLRNWCLFYQKEYKEGNRYYYMGLGIGVDPDVEAEIYLVPDKKTYDRWKEILTKTFEGSSIPYFFPLDCKLAVFSVKSGYDIFYLHNNIPRLESYKPSLYEKKINNLLFRFKEGSIPELVARLFSIGIKHMPYFHLSKSETLIIPIPASTREKHQKRFQAVCLRLARELKIDENGYFAVGIKKDRKPLKGTRGLDKIYNLSFDARQIQGKYIILLDDVFNTGESFIQMSDKLKSLGAKHVCGVFLVKTVHKDPYYL